MPNKKGSKVAASQARAQAKARKKARSSGPAIPAAAYAPPVATSDEDVDALDEVAVDAVATTGEEGLADEAAEEERPAPTAVAPRRTARHASRRQRVAMAAVQSGSLRRELILISVVTAFIGVALAVVKLATDLGR
jgi:hypothetical protein